MWNFPVAKLMREPLTTTLYKVLRAGSRKYVLTQQNLHGSGG